MLYEGYFRSLDTTLDPNGQQYKVQIFTDGELYQNMSTITDTGIVYWPARSTEIKLSGKPFTVTYANDENNIYKPYKGSSAEVGIILESTISRLIVNTKCKVLVRLLKLKKGIQNNGNTIVNTETNESINKTLVVGVINSRVRTLFNDFIPEQYDNFCYDVEWLGYATPNTYNLPYTNIIEEYVMECQDVLTCLKYYDYPNSETGASSFMESIVNSLNLIPNNPIKNVYVTNSITIPQLNRICILDILKSINENWTDEDYEWNDALSVISNLMQYINATVIQWKDSLYIYAPDAITNQRQYYYKHALDGNVCTPMVLVDGIYDITDNELGNSDTTLSTTSTYKKVELTTSEYYDDNLSIALNDDNEELNEINRWDSLVTFNKIYDCDRNILSELHPYNYDVSTGSASFAGSIYNYVADTTKNHATIERYTYNRDTEDPNNEGHALQDLTRRSNATTWSNIFWSVGCSIVDIQASELSTDSTLSDYMQSYSGSKVFLFHSPSPLVIAARTGFAISPLITPLNKFTDSGLQEARKVLSINLKKAFMKSGQSLLIKGELMFYLNITLPMASGWQQDTLKAYKPYMFIWVKVSLPIGDTTYYLHNTSYNNHGSYTWSTTEKWCKLWYDNYAGLDKDANKKNRQSTTSYAFETSFSFTKNTRGADGTCIELPTALGEGQYASIKVEFARMYGCCLEKRVTGAEPHFYACQYATLSGFEVNIIDTESTNFRYTENTNNKFISTMNQYATDDYSSISLLVSSDYYKNTSKASVIGLPNNRLNNQATGVNSLPEANIIRNIIKTYLDPRIKLNITLPKEVTPFTLVKWTSQFPDVKFVIDSLEIDYAYNDYTINIFEKTLSDVEPTIYSEKKSRNTRRNGDYLFNDPLPYKNKKELNMSQSELRPPLVLFSTGTNGDVYVNQSLMRNVTFEPIISEGRLILAKPDYLTNMVVTTNENGEIIINY